ATASTNCCSVSQPNSFTTPPYKKGTIARPLPKTNAPAFVKNQAICHSFSDGVANAAVVIATATGAVSNAGKIFFGGAFNSQVTIPPARISQMLSDSVSHVDTARTIKITHNNLSFPILLDESL